MNLTISVVRSIPHHPSPTSLLRRRHGRRSFSHRRRRCRRVRCCRVLQARRGPAGLSRPSKRSTKPRPSPSQISTDSYARCRRRVARRAVALQRVARRVIVLRPVLSPAARADPRGRDRGGGGRPEHVRPSWRSSISLATSPLRIFLSHADDGAARSLDETANRGGDDPKGAEDPMGGAILLGRTTRRKRMPLSSRTASAQ